MTVRIADDFAVTSRLAPFHNRYQFFFPDSFDEPLREDHDAVKQIKAAAFDHRAYDNVAKLVQGNRTGLKFFGNDRQGSSGRFADAKGQMACRSTHADNDIPTRGRAGIFSQIANDANTD